MFSLLNFDFNVMFPTGFIGDFFGHFIFFQGVLVHLLEFNQNHLLIFLSNLVTHSKVFLVFSDKGIVSIFDSMLCSWVAQDLYDFTPRLLFSQNVVDEDEVLLQCEFIFFFRFIQVVVPSLATGFRSSENSPLSMEKDHLGDIVPIVEYFLIVLISLEGFDGGFK